MESTKEETKPAYRLGIALSGGGARGFAHAGALKAIEEAGLKPDIIAGVSAGAVVAVMYSAGIPTEKMLEVFKSSKFNDFTELSLRGGGGLFKIDKFRNFILKHISPIKKLEDLKIPTYIGVTNFDTGLHEEFHEGDIGPVVQASCSIPIIFKPVKINGANYVDGGVVRNLPAWAIREKCETLIGINVSPLTTSASKRPGYLETAQRTFALMGKANVLDDLKVCDHLIEMREISKYKVFNLKEIDKVFLSGYVNARHVLRQAGLWNPLPETNARDKKVSKENRKNEKE